MKDTPLRSAVPSTVLPRREFLVASAAAGMAALGGWSSAAAAEADADSLQAMLQETVGRRQTIAGIIAISVDRQGSRLTSHGSSGVENLAMDGDTVFEIGSVTKVLTALLLADMAQRGEVSIDDPVAEYLPQSAKPGVRGITLLDLATYTSGLPEMPDNMPPDWFKSPNPLADYTPDELYAFLSGHTPEYEPGAHYEYSNLAFGVLGLALARRAGKSYEALLTERVCGPLGLDHTRIALSPDMQRHVAERRNLDVRPAPLLDMPAFQGAGAVRSTASDLTGFLNACIGLKESPLHKAFSSLVETRRPTPLSGTEAALGWFISAGGEEEIVWKTGVTGGCNTFVGYSTRTRRGAIVLANFLSRPAGGGPVDGSTLNIGMHMLNPDFHPGNLALLY